MLLRVLFILFCLILCAPSAQAAACLDVFPSGWRENTPANEQLINFPSNFSGATLTDGTTLPRGDNLYNNSNLGNKGEVYVSGLSGSETTARLFFRSSVSWQNVKINENGDPEDLIIVIDGGLQITGGSTVINAIIYVKGTTSVNGNSTINGAAATVGSSDLFNVNYDESYITNADFNGMCNNTPSEPTPITEHRFDETLYTGVPGEVVDSIGDFHGQAINSQPVEGKVCNAIDLSTTGTSDYAVLDKDILTGKTDFTISLWSQTSKTSNQSILSGAGNNSSNELIMWFINHTNFRPYLKGSQNGVITTSSIADDNWQHIVWTREGSQNCLFIDKELQGCVSLTTLPLDIQSLILGQEQDSVGGGFSSSQAFDGLLDELLVFDSAISPDDIAIIYDNQNAGLGYDGSTRDCPVPVFPSPVLDIHFDELNWDADDSIIDISGNDYHANAVNVSPTEGFICNAADLTATGINDYITLDSEAMNNLSNFSISLWYQTPKTGPQSIISGSSISSFNELIFWFTNNTLFSPFIKGGARSIVTENVSDGVWHHLVWTRSGSRNLFYRDGVLQTGSAILSTGAVNITSLILGQEQDSLGGTFDASQAVEGLVDELLIFDKALSAEQVLTVFDNESAGLNYDGTERSCGRGEPIAEWRMDEQTWNGSAGEVIDDSGNDYHGKAVSTSPTEGFICNAADLSATGTNDYLSLDHNAINGLKDFTLSAWVNTDRTSAQTILSVANSTQSNEAVFYYENNTSSWPTLRESPFNTSTKTAVSNISTGTWKHHVWTRKTNVNNGELCLYIDNVLQGCSTHNNGEFAIDVDATGFILGQEQDLLGGDFDSSQAFSGLLDEVLLFDTVLSSNDIGSINNNQSQGKNWDGTDRSCANFIDHFEINTLNAQGITCEADDIIIKACADASCSTVNPDAVDVKLFINNVENKTVTVSGNNGTSTSYSYTTVGNAALSLDQDYECKDSNSKPCIVDFKDSGFIISDIPMQISGKPSSEGFNATTLSLRAVETNTTTGACINTFPNDTDVAVNLSYSCAGGDCEDLLALGNNGNSYNLTETATARGLYFSTDSTAIFTLNYPHAGKFIINAQKDVEVEDTDGNKLIKDFSVSSNSFVERPFGIKLDFSNDSNGSKALAESSGGVIDTDGSPFKKAGESFTLTATAMQWVNGQDETGAGSVPDGIPDDFAVFNQNTLKADNFAGGEISINNDLLLPNPGNNPVLNIIESNSFNTNTSSLDNKYSFDEVGIIELKSTLAGNDYLGAGDILGKVTNVGRFIPAHFVQTIEDGNQGSLTANHDNNHPLICNMLDWVYTGQLTDNEGTIKYSIEPVLTITAQNSDGVKTVNYIGEFAKLLNVDNETVTSKNKITFSGPSTLGLPLLGNVTGTGEMDTDSGGVLTYQLPEQHHFVYIRNSASEVVPFNADFELPFSQFKDSDDVTIKPSSGSTNYFQNPHFYQLEASGFDNTVEVRFGRWYVENAFGPETSSLPTPMYVQYLKETGFEINKDDNCTVPDIEDEINSGAIWSGGLTAWQYRLLDASTDINEPITPEHTSATAPDPLISFSDGEYREFIFSPPGAGNIGSLELEYQVPPWLQYDWNDDDSFTNNPTSTLTFGIYRGNDRIIYQREISR
jgi:MSHA biogenesis protein MshQ